MRALLLAALCTAPTYAQQQTQDELPEAVIVSNLDSEAILPAGYTVLHATGMQSNLDAQGDPLKSYAWEARYEGGSWYAVDDREHCYLELDAVGTWDLKLTVTDIEGDYDSDTLTIEATDPDELDTVFLDSSAGDDDTGDGSETSPYQTLQAVWDNYPASVDTPTVIMLKAGQEHGWISYSGSIVPYIFDRYGSGSDPKLLGSGTITLNHNGEDFGRGSRFKNLDIRPDTGNLQYILSTHASGTQVIDCAIVNGGVSAEEFGRPGASGYVMLRSSVTNSPRTGLFMTEDLALIAESGFYGDGLDWVHDQGIYLTHCDDALIAHCDVVGDSEEAVEGVSAGWGWNLAIKMVQDNRCLVWDCDLSATRFGFELGSNNGEGNGNESVDCILDALNVHDTGHNGGSGGGLVDHALRGIIRNSWFHEIDLVPGGGTAAIAFSYDHEYSLEPDHHPKLWIVNCCFSNLEVWHIIADFLEEEQFWLRVYNCAFYEDEDGDYNGFWDIRSDTDLPSIDSENNVYYNDELAYDESGTFKLFNTEKSFDDWQNSYGFDQASLYDDPEFDAPTSGDLDIRSTSPCIDAGRVLWRRGWLDRYGNARPANDWDVGAEED